MRSFSDIIENIKALYGISDITDAELIVRLVVEGIIVLFFFFLYLYLIREKELSVKRVVFFFIAYVFVFAVIYILNLPLALDLMKVLGIFILLVPLFWCNDVKRKIYGKAENKKVNSAVKTERDKEALIGVIVEAVERLSKDKTGALITIENKDSLQEYVDRSSAVKLDAVLSAELLWTIFYEGTALHDGAVIIRDGKVAYASVQFDPTKRADLDKSYGMRHRAGLGVSEQTDSVTIIVSEETRKISICYDGTIYSDLEVSEIRQYLEDYAYPDIKQLDK